MVPKTGQDEVIRIGRLRHFLKTLAMEAIPSMMQSEILNKYEVALKNLSIIRYCKI